MWSQAALAPPGNVFCGYWSVNPPKKLLFHWFFELFEKLGKILPGIFTGFFFGPSGLFLGPSGYLDASGRVADGWVSGSRLRLLWKFD